MKRINFALWTLLLTIPCAVPVHAADWLPKILESASPQFRTSQLMPTLAKLPICPLSGRPNRCSRFSTETILRGASGKKTTLHLTGSGANDVNDYFDPQCTPDDSLPNGSSGLITHLSKLDDLESISVSFIVPNATNADPCPSFSKLAYQVRRAHNAVPLQYRDFELISHYYKDCYYKTTFTGADLGLLLQQLPDSVGFEFVGELCAAGGGNRWGQQFRISFTTSPLDETSEDFMFQGRFFPADLIDLPLPLAPAEP